MNKPLASATAIGLVKEADSIAGSVKGFGSAALEDAHLRLGSKMIDYQPGFTPQELLAIKINVGGVVLKVLTEPLSDETSLKAVLKDCVDALGPIVAGNYFRNLPITKP
jgi:hypothetical protein